MTADLILYSFLFCHSFMCRSHTGIQWKKCLSFHGLSDFCWECLCQQFQQSLACSSLVLSHAFLLKGRVLHVDMQDLYIYSSEQARLGEQKSRVQAWSNVTPINTLASLKKTLARNLINSSKNPGSSFSVQLTHSCTAVHHHKSWSQEKIFQ